MGTFPIGAVSFFGVTAMQKYFVMFFAIVAIGFGAINLNLINFGQKQVNIVECFSTAHGRTFDNESANQCVKLFGKTIPVIKEKDGDTVHFGAYKTNRSAAIELFNALNDFGVKSLPNDFDGWWKGLSVAAK